jgi:pseudouridine-5'-phosphate glycosidase
MTAIEPLFSPPVRDALDRGQPVVVLESTVIAQGLPWPSNLETAVAMETAVTERGGVPATIAIIDGVVRIGLSAADLEQVAVSAAGPEPGTDADPAAGGACRPAPFAKANRRDLGVHLARGGRAATTVSATLWLARRFGVGPCIMATGGLGGVHRGAAESFDVSTDLDELARSDGAMVVCSGAKSILDLPATLEALESLGVAVLGHRTGEFPAFTTVSSGLPLEHRVESAAEAAAILRAHRQLGVPGALVLANPAPVADAIERDVMESALERAIEAARRLGIAGKAITPFLLDEVRRATGGRSLRANQALLVANARLAAEVAVALRT